MKARGLLLCLLAAACGDEAAEARNPVQIEFAVMVGDEPFVCGATYENLGSSGSSFTPRDLRFYVQDVRLVEEDGTERKVRLEADGKWQLEDVALLDFEGDTPECSSGTSDTNRMLRGEVAGSSFSRLRFALGVPFSRNHADAATAPSPLNLTTMFWSWRDGYKFIRFEAETEAEDGFYLHVGSTGCDGGLSGGTRECVAPNRVEVDLPWQEGAQVILDVGALVEGSDLSGASGRPSCMSGDHEEGCVPLFSRLGLAFGDGPAGDQQVFRAR